MINLWILLLCFLYFTNIYNEQFALVSVPSQTTNANPHVSSIGD